MERQRELTEIVDNRGKRVMDTEIFYDQNSCNLLFKKKCKESKESLVLIRLDLAKFIVIS